MRGNPCGVIGIPVVKSASGGRVLSRNSTADRGISPRLEFRATDENMADASWEPFFRAFDRHKLAFHYQERTDDGRTSRFYQFVRPRSE